MSFPREKLIRHLVPIRLAEQGEKCETRQALQSEILGLLRNKVVEEAEELVEAIDSGNHVQMVEELADLFEVVGALRERLGDVEVDDKIREKTFDRGTIRRGVVLKLDPPEPKVLFCPYCNGQHVDRGVWATRRIHRTHLCESCGKTFKPFPFATVGVAGPSGNTGTGRIGGATLQPPDKDNT